jgi:alpha-1,3-rhamnosyl/mannosyltransferase
MTQMRVAIEAGPLALTSGGLSRFTTDLALALARGFPDDEYFLISDQTFQMPTEAPPNLKRGGGPRNALERRWWLWGIARELDRLHADVVHGPDYSVPYLALRPSVLSLHDLSPWMDERWHHAAGRVRRRTPVLMEMGVATMVMTPSERVRREAINRFRLRPDRVVAVPYAAAEWFRPVQTMVARPYFLFVGTLEPRKNVPALIEAWRAVRRHHEIDLVLAGRPRADAPAIPDDPGIRVLGEVPDEALPELYSGALALVFPSFYEGFGLPVLEAMQCGACVIASKAVVEVAGEAAVYADDVATMALAMEHAAEHPEFVAEQRARSLARAREFSWERAARMTREVYEEARRRFGN